MGITIEDVAERAGVSTATVSRVFNGKGRIAEDTRERVLGVASEMGYSPRKYNKKVNMKNIAVINHKWVNSETPLTAFYSRIVEGMEEVFKKDNFQLMIKTLNEDKKQNKKIAENIIENNNYRGIVIIGYEIEEYIIKKIKENKNLPMIFIDNENFSSDDTLINDNFKGTLQLAEHLIERGHKNIAFIGGPHNHLSLYKRYMGYKYVLEQAGIYNEKICFRGESCFNLEGGYKTAHKIFENYDNVTAIMAANDYTALGVLKAAQELGIQVPGEIAITGFDDIMMSRHSHPPLTTVRVFKKKMGKMAANRLLELIEKKKNVDINVDVEKKVFRVETVIRGSTVGNKSE